MSKKKNKDAFQQVGDAAIKAADELNKFGKKAERVLKGKPPRRRKEVVAVSKMKTTTLYKGVDDHKLYRKFEERLEVMENGVWKEVKLSFGFLNSMKFREY